MGVGVGGWVGWVGFDLKLKRRPASTARDYCFVHTCCKNMQMASLLHIHITAQALRCTTKEGNGFRQPAGTPKSWGQSVHITPLQLMHCSSWEKAPVP